MRGMSVGGMDEMDGYGGRLVGLLRLFRWLAQTSGLLVVTDQETFSIGVASWE